MTFSSIPARATVFLDANTLVYHFGPDPNFGQACTDLLLRIQRQEITAYVSTHVLAEVSHRLMTIEAIQVFGWPLTGIGPRLRKHPADVQKLKLFHQAMRETSRFNVQVLTIDPGMMDLATDICLQTGLLTNDALIVAVMQQHGITNIASHDADFDRVAGIVRYGPV